MILHRLLTHAAYWSVIVLLLGMVPPNFLGDPRGAQAALLTIGILGTWRYTWAATNFARAAWFLRVSHPRRTRERERAFAAAPGPSHCFFMVTTYMVDEDATVPVYRSIFDAAREARDGATIVASVVDGKDARLIRALFEGHPGGTRGVTLVIDRIRSEGKRDAMAKALRILAGMAPSSRDLCVFVDGDTIVPRDVWRRSAPVFTDPRVGALTTDEAAIVGRDGLFKDWFDLRFDQRQVMMCSMAQSHHVLTLTGRMSVFRASLSMHPGFVEAVSDDSLEHWRLGRVDFLTGDDKSTWFWLLRRGYLTEYLPDIRSVSFESQPRPGFVESARVLMIRWFGNMMRNNGRALRLGMRGMGPFTWWSILDQRVSMFTTLVGPISVAVAALGGVPSVLPLYAAWVLATRYLFCAAISCFRGRWFPVTFPPILYFGQVFGAALKTFVFFRLDRQKWTRQGSGGAVALSGDARAKRRESAAFHGLALGWLTLAILFVNAIE